MGAGLLLRNILAKGLAIALVATPVASAGASLPDWSGAWARIGTNVFDPATSTPGAAGDPGVREFPPYSPVWEAKYRENLAKVAVDHLPDPLTFCGVPAGFPRLMSLPDLYEFALTPNEVWILTENGPNLMRIYTDGRPHPSGDDVWSTYTGDSVGHWEGDTLVFDTIGLKGGVILDRTGVELSDQARVTTRIRLANPATLEARMEITDPIALTRPWRVVRTWRRQAKGTRVYDYACAENNRNPVAASGKTLTLGSDGKPIDRDR